MENKRFRFCAFCLFFFCSVNLSPALALHLHHHHKQAPVQVQDSAEFANIEHGFLRTCGNDGRKILSSPGRWDQEDWTRFFLVAGAARGLYAFDRKIRDDFQEDRSHGRDMTAMTVRNFGNGGYTLPALGMYFWYGNNIEDQHKKDTALLGIESFLFSGALTSALKMTVHRQRPNESTSSSSWGEFGFSAQHQSFPSGHTTSAFAVATVIAEEYHYRPWVPVFSYGLAAMTGWSRLNDNYHWASDVAFGGATGYFTAKTILRLHNGEHRSRFTPYATGSQAGLTLNF